MPKKKQSLQSRLLMTANVPVLKLKVEHENILRTIKDDDAFVNAVLEVSELYAANAEIWDNTPTRKQEIEHVSMMFEAAQKLYELLTNMPDRAWLHMSIFAEQKREFKSQLATLVLDAKSAVQTLEKPKAGAPKDHARWFAARKLCEVFGKFNLQWRAGQLRDSNFDDPDGRHPAIDALWVVFETARNCTGGSSPTRNAVGDYVSGIEQELSQTGRDSCL
jgi:hypothetical protein